MKLISICSFILLRPRLFYNGPVWNVTTNGSILQLMTPTDVLKTLEQERHCFCGLPLRTQSLLEADGQEVASPSETNFSKFDLYHFNT
jgi:hypothetical protein